ncbi:MAG TPA: DUF6111 family protein [Alphaproteobacteria bacterium]|nr:DUF6111 family protein [Alphaproteobacteria bacterium]
MLGRLLYHLIPFLLPFALYALYLKLSRRAEDAGQPGLDSTPWFWLVVVGLVLSAASVLAYWWVVNQPPGGTYVPPHVENGQVVPGHIER